MRPSASVRSPSGSPSGSVLIVAWIAAVDGLGGLTDMSARAVWLLAISVVLAVGVGDTIFFESVKWLGLVRAMTMSMVYPLFAALLAALLLGEAPTLQVSVGGLLTLTGLIGAKWRSSVWAHEARIPLARSLER